MAVSDSEISYRALTQSTTHGQMDAWVVEPNPKKQSQETSKMASGKQRCTVPNGQKTRSPKVLQQRVQTFSRSAFAVFPLPSFSLASFSSTTQLLSTVPLSNTVLYHVTTCEMCYYLRKILADTKKGVRDCKKNKIKISVSGLRLGRLS